MTQLPLSPRAERLAPSLIRKVAETGMGRQGVLSLWFGEGIWPTPAFIVAAAQEALAKGAHFYTPNNGIPSLRSAIAGYSSDLCGTAISADRITVTASGMLGLSLTALLLAGPGDRVVTIAPGWPNVPAAFRSAGAEIATVPLTPSATGWALDLDRLIDAARPGTRAVVVNSPSNPTGWVMPVADQARLLDHCRAHDIWIVADDVYQRLYRHGRAAPSFLSLAGPDDLLLSVNSFSKCWSMTGWRLGWITGPAAVTERLGQLTEFTNSCAPAFVQIAGEAAIREGEPEIDRLRARLDAAFDATFGRLRALPRVTCPEPQGAFYCFFRVDGMTDSLDAALRILDETGVGLAPGAAFGPEGEGWLRLCYAQPPEVMARALDRLQGWLS